MRAFLFFSAYLLMISSALSQGIIRGKITNPVNNNQSLLPMFLS